MMSGIQYVVRRGDCLSSLAKRHGLPSWRTIYDHPNNAAFREQRPDPNLIYPGDKVFVPDVDPTEVPGGTEKRHKYRTRSEKVCLNIKLEDDNGVACEGGYRVIVGSLDETGQLSNGELSVEISATETEGRLIYTPTNGPPDSETTWQLHIGALDPLNYLSGAQGRLHNLAYDCGPVDGLDGPLTQAGVRRFQEFAFPHDEDEWDGIVGPKTRGKLLEHHEI